MADCVDEFMKNFRSTEEKIKEINKEIEIIKVREPYYEQSFSLIRVGQISK